MHSNLTTDIFKFLSIRPAEKRELKKCLYIFDNRLKSPPSIAPGEKNKALFNLIWTIFSEIEKSNCKKADGKNLSLAEMKSKNSEIAEELENKWDEEYIKSGQINEEKEKDDALLQDFRTVLDAAIDNFSKTKLYNKLEKVIHKYKGEKTSLTDYVLKPDFEGGGGAHLMNELFDMLYAQYIIKRKKAINLEKAIENIQTIHTVRQISIDHEYRATRRKGFFNIILNALKIVYFFRKKNYKNPKLQYETVSVEESVKEIFDATKKLRISKPNCLIDTSADLKRHLNAQPIIPPQFAYLYFFNCPFNPIKPVGIGDLKVVKQKLLKYEAGEIAHIENVLKGEYKKRSHRNLKRAEDFFSTIQEDSQESEKELQTTERFEIQKEVENVVNQDLSVKAGVTVSGGFGPVKVTSYGDFAYGKSTEDSQRAANNFSKEIVARSLERVQKKVKTERESRRLNEVEEINKHTLNNERRNQHISGIYRYVDKLYESQIYNYGKRLMFEFVIPEPSSLYLSAFNENIKSQFEKPIEPESAPNEKPTEINQEVVNKYMQRFNLIDVEPQPNKETRNTTVTYVRPQSPQNAEEITIPSPAGFTPIKVSIQGSFETNGDNPGAFSITGSWNNAAGRLFNENTDNDDYGLNKIADLSWNWPEDAVGDNDPFQLTADVIIEDNVNEIKFGISAQNITSINLAFTTTFISDKKTLIDWQGKTYNKIMTAYYKEQENYLDKLAKYKEEVITGINGQPKGKNPAINQEIIKEELKRLSLSYIAKFFDEENNGEEIFDAMKSRKAKMRFPGNIGKSTEINLPAININESIKEGRLIQYFEQAFDWNNITYLLYPFFWGNIEKWYGQFEYLEETDPFFATFLRAGAAKVLISVEPHFEQAVMHYLFTGEPWNGGPAPVIGDDLYIPIYEELHNQQDDLRNAQKEGEPWEYVVPTSLVYLQQGSELPTFY